MTSTEKFAMVMVTLLVVVTLLNTIALLYLAASVDNLSGLTVLEAV